MLIHLGFPGASRLGSELLGSSQPEGWIVDFFGRNKLPSFLGSLLLVFFSSSDMNGHYLPARSGCNERNWNNITTYCILLTTHISQISLVEAGRVGIGVKEKMRKKMKNCCLSLSLEILAIYCCKTSCSPPKHSSFEMIHIYIRLSMSPEFRNSLSGWDSYEVVAKMLARTAVIWRTDWGWRMLLWRLLTSMAYMLDWWWQMASIPPMQFIGSSVLTKLQLVSFNVGQFKNVRQNLNIFMIWPHKLHSSFFHHSIGYTYQHSVVVEETTPGGF